MRAGLMASLRDPARQWLALDILAVLLATALPWSTSAVAILVVLWLIALTPIVDWWAFLSSLRRPAAALPLAFFALAVVGTLWSGSSWPARLHGINPVAKLLVIPFLLYHFERSQRAEWVLKAFLASCTLLMALSWICFFEPALKISSTPDPGVPVKNYIDQSQEFAFCLFALAPLVFIWMNSRQFLRCAAAFLLIMTFFANMMFVVSARTALVYIPVLLVVFALMHLRARSIAILLIGALLAGALIWVTSPYIRHRVEKVSSEYQAYRSTNAATSTGERLEFWRKSLRFVSNSPLIGNGTGSTKALFERDALGQKGVSAKIIGNPHNQTLNVAVQWGLVGVLVLYTMWLIHLLLFRGTGMVAWIGTLVVLQNFVSSIFNSHLFDFHEGWMYVLGVGVAGGAMLQHLNGKSDVPSDTLRDVMKFAVPDNDDTSS